MVPSVRIPGENVSYGYVGSMKVKPGHRDDVLAILLRAAEGVTAFGCTRYIVSVSATDPDTIWTFEVWPSKEDHEASLRAPEVKEAVGEAMPMLTGEFTGQELSIAGGLGV
jgi:quinol monooxygenase YgiN